MKAVIFGAPGSGKGTYSTRLQDQLGVTVISMGDIFRSMLKEDNILSRVLKRYMSAGLLVPDPIVLEVLADTINRVQDKGFILDGFPRTLPQAEALDKITKLDVVIQLDVPDWIIIERLSSRRICKNCGNAYNLQFLKPKVEGVCDKCGGPLYLRADDNPETVKKRLEVYQKETSPLLQFYTSQNVPIIRQVTDSLDMPPEIAVKHIIAELQKLKLA
jgi:adenylate kinase